MSASAPSTGLRERHKQQRRERILEAIRELLRECPDETPTVERIAARCVIGPQARSQTQPFASVCALQSTWCSPRVQARTAPRSSMRRCSAIGGRDSNDTSCCWVRRSTGIRLAADTFGDPDAPAVPMLHGGGQTRHAWYASARNLADAGWRAITVDLRGHGAQSDVLTVGIAREFIELAATATLTEVPYAGHMVAGNNNAVTAAIRAWLDTFAARTPPRPTTARLCRAEPGRARDPYARQRRGGLDDVC